MFLDIHKVETALYSCSDNVLDYIQMINASWFKDAAGIHGINHSIRLLHLVGKAGYLFDCTDSQLGILFFCCILHDIGRVHNYVDESHGELSVQKIKCNENILNLLNKRLNAEQISTLCDIIYLHSLPLPGYNGVQKKLLSIFMDCDAIERMRFNGLDISYIRNPEILVLIGYELELLRKYS